MTQTQYYSQEHMDTECQRAREEERIALARKVIAVSRSNNPMRPRGMTMKMRLELLTHEMQKIIPDPFGESLRNPRIITGELRFRKSQKAGNDGKFNLSGGS